MDGAGDDDVVAQLVVEEGTHGAVDEAGIEGTALGGTAFTAVEGAGNAAHRVQTLFKFDGQGEVVDARLGGGGGDGGDEDDGVAVTADTLTVAQLADLAGFDGEGPPADFGLEDVVIGKLLVGDHRSISFRVVDGLTPAGRFST